MPRDYKHRVQNPGYGGGRRRQQKSPAAWWRWLLIFVLIAVFVVFLNLVRSMVAELIAGNSNSDSNQTASAVVKELPIQSGEQKQQQKEPEQTKIVTPEPAEPESPRYDFYTILPQSETVVPDYEIQTRVREELVGKSKAAKYVMQAGSFRGAADAEKHKAKLALLGIESWIEKAKVENVIWHRVKIGPYDNPSSVSTIKALLEKNGIGVIVTEQGK